MIYFVLKNFESWYRILALLDVLFFIIAVIFVFKFVEIWEVKKYINKKEFLNSQIIAFKNWINFFVKSKNILVFLLIMILWNDLWYLARVLLPNLVENWVSDFLSSYVI